MLLYGPAAWQNRQVRRIWVTRNRPRCCCWVRRRDLTSLYTYEGAFEPVEWFSTGRFFLFVVLFNYKKCSTPSKNPKFPFQVSIQASQQGALVSFQIGNPGVLVSAIINGNHGA